VETSEASARLDVPSYRASQILKSLEDAGLVQRLRQGLWALQPPVNPDSVPPYLTAPFPAYISFWSALARHEMIEQIPRQIFVASLDRSRRIKTTVATYSIHHITPDLFDGYKGSPEVGYLATPEKALFDTVYFRASRGGDIYLPELELPDGFDESELTTWTTRVARPRLRTLVERGLRRALASADRQ
jgi:predicted transcriptional regulator of viral defense system